MVSCGLDICADRKAVGFVYGWQPTYQPAMGIRRLQPIGLDTP